LVFKKAAYILSLNLDIFPGDLVSSFVSGSVNLLSTSFSLALEFGIVNYLIFGNSLLFGINVDAFLFGFVTIPNLFLIIPGNGG